MEKRLLSILLVLIMALSVLPTAAFAEDGGENLPACICETACTAEEMNIDCPGCGAEGAQPGKLRSVYQSAGYGRSRARRRGRRSV